jgi:hypothetical protein
MLSDNSGEKGGRAPSIVRRPSPLRQPANSGNVKRPAVSSISDSASKRLDIGGHANMVERLCEIGDFVRKLRTQTRFGELSRAPLRLLRFELRDDVAECDWISRPRDPWDEELPQIVGERHASSQALQDAMAIRDLIFRTLSDLDNVVVRAYRLSTTKHPELIITGTVSRGQYPPAAVRSLAMRAKLSGLQFSLDEGVLENLLQEDSNQFVLSTDCHVNTQESANGSR